MSKKKKHHKNTHQIKVHHDETPRSDETNYYQMHSDAIDRLINAEDGEVPEVGAEELKQYESGVLSKIPSWLKALFIKFWFNGAVCFFFMWGLGIYITNYWNLLFVVGLALGVITDLLVNNIFRFTADQEHDNDKWMLFPQKKFWTFFANIAYAYVILACVVLLYSGINALFGDGEEISLGVEPFLFGLFYLLFDMAVISIKNLIAKAVANSKQKDSTSEQEPNSTNE